MVKTIAKIYIRDGRAPIPKDPAISKVMSANRGKDTKPEVALRKVLWNKGIKGYRLHWKKVPGRPDIAFIGKKVAIFVNGCYWHRCPSCKLPAPKTNKVFWKNKFKRNIERDKKKTEVLEKDGWKVLTVWECEIKNKVNKCVNKIKSLLKNK